MTTTRILATASIITFTLAGLAAILMEKAMYELHTEIQIDASPERVWDILTDASQFDQWNPFIHQLHGKLSPGERLQVVVGAPGKSRMGFKPEVLVVEPARELRWIGKLLFSGLFDGEHIFELYTDEKGTRLVHREQFTGLLVPLFKGMLERDTRPGFELMNEALKQRAERQQLAAAN